jgi:hypothetical protein
MGYWLLFHPRVKDLWGFVLARACRSIFVGSLSTGKSEKRLRRLVARAAGVAAATQVRSRGGRWNLGVRPQPVVQSQEGCLAGRPCLTPNMLNI